MPLALWLEANVNTEDDETRMTSIVGLGAPHGGGSTMLMDCILPALEEIGIKSALVKYEDFQVTAEEHKKIAEENKNNRYMQGYGLPGCHDI